MTTASPLGVMEPVIRLSGLSKVFQTEEVDTHALQRISLSISAGEFVAVTGPSGCGKSTLLALLGLLDAPSSGDYFLRGRAVAQLKTAERARVRNREIGFIFQSFNLISDLTVEQNVALPLTYRDDLDRATRDSMVAKALDRVSIGHRSKHYPSQLSGGQQQRAAVARALAGRPALLLADEPTGNLDSANGEAVMALLQELHAEGSTICMVTHDATFAQRASRIILLHDGCVVEDPAQPSLTIKSLDREGAIS